MNHERVPGREGTCRPMDSDDNVKVASQCQGAGSTTSRDGFWPVRKRDRRPHTWITTRAGFRPICTSLIQTLNYSVLRVPLTLVVHNVCGCVSAHDHSCVMSLNEKLYQDSGQVRYSNACS